METNDITLPRETSEFLQVPVYVDDVKSLSFEVCCVRWPQRPSGWAQASIDGDDAGIIVSGLTPGRWQVWVRVASVIVVAAGTIWVD